MRRVSHERLGLVTVCGVESGIHERIAGLDADDPVSDGDLGPGEKRINSGVDGPDPTEVARDLDGDGGAHLMEFVSAYLGGFRHEGNVRGQHSGSANLHFY
jgi:hypothetical protein